MKSPTHKDKLIKQQKDALRDLERMNDQSEVIGTSTMAKAANVDNNPIDANDPIEILGKKIGRGLGAIAVIGLIIYLYMTYFQPAG